MCHVAFAQSNSDKFITRTRGRSYTCVETPAVLGEVFNCTIAETGEAFAIEFSYFYLYWESYLVRFHKGILMQRIP